MDKISTAGVPSAALGTGSSDSAPPSAVSRDKSVRRSVQDDDLVASWRCKKAFSDFLLSAKHVSAYGVESSLQDSNAFAQTHCRHSSKQAAKFLAVLEKKSSQKGVKIRRLTRLMPQLLCLKRHEVRFS